MSMIISDYPSIFPLGFEKYVPKNRQPLIYNVHDIDQVREKHKGLKLLRYEGYLFVSDNDSYPYIGLIKTKKLFPVAFIPCCFKKINNKVHGLDRVFKI